jgi:hypothetical protein
VKPETRFRVNRINPFLKTLNPVFCDAIQQAAKVGSLDYYMCLGGRFVAVEAKADDGAPSEKQKDNIFKIRRAGGIAIITSPSGTPESLPWAAAKVLLTKLAKGEALDDSDQRNANHEYGYPRDVQGDL